MINYAIKPPQSPLSTLPTSLISFPYPVQLPFSLFILTLKFPQKTSLLEKEE